MQEVSHRKNWQCEVCRFPEAALVPELVWDEDAWEFQSLEALVLGTTKMCQCLVDF